MTTKSIKLYLLILFYVSLSQAIESNIDLNLGVIQSNFTKGFFFNDHSEYRTGLIVNSNIEFKLVRNIFVSCGIKYEQVGALFVSNFVIMDSIGNVRESYARDITDYSLDYIGIPIKIGMSYGNKVYIHPKIGIDLSKLISAFVISPIYYTQGKPDVYIMETIHPNRNGISYLIETEIGYNIMPTNSFYLNLSFKRSLNDVSSSIFGPNYHFGLETWSFALGWKHYFNDNKKCSN
jgi:hypothetical protein